MSENDARLFVVTLRRALLMLVAWAEEWLSKHPINEKVQ